MPSPRIADIRSRALLLLILGVGLFLRVDNLSWGLPDYYVPDERVFTAENWERMESSPPVAAHFVYPHLHIRTVALMDAVASRLGADAAVTSQILRARIFGAVLSLLTVVLTFAIGRELFGRPIGLAAAAFLAVAPYPVVDAHVNLSDGALAFWISASFLLAARGRRSEHPGWLLASGLLAGLAGAAKYPGMAVVVAPLWVSLFAVAPPGGEGAKATSGLRPPGRILWMASGVLLFFTIGLFAGSPRSVLEWELSLESIQTSSEVIYALGSGSTLPTDGLLGTRYLYQLLVALPFSLGALAWVLATLGLVSMTRSAPRPAILILTFVIPYFAVIGGSSAVFARYCLPLAPFLCVGAGFLSIRLLQAPGWRRGLAGVVVGAAIVHALLFAYRQADGFVDENRSEVVSWLEARTSRSLDPRPRAEKPKVGVPNFSRRYDGVLSRIREIPSVRLVGMPPDAAQLAKAAPDYLVLSMPFLMRALRQEAGEGGSFWRDLSEEELGYRRVAVFEPRFRAEGIYSVLDPLQVHAWTNGDIGFWIYEREGTSRRR